MRVALLFLIFFLSTQQHAFSQEENILLNDYIEKKIKHNENSKNGYCILLYNGNEKEARDIYVKFTKHYKSINARLKYASPDWKVVTPTYASKLKAEKVYIKIRKLYPHAKIV